MLVNYKNSENRSFTFKSKSTLIEHYNEQTRATIIMAFSINLIIAFVGILNFVNSMVTEIVSRQKEFAIIQNIGMTKRKLRSMLIYDGLYYAVSTLISSYLLGSLAVGFGIRAMVAGLESNFLLYRYAACNYVIPCLIVSAEEEQPIGIWE